MGTMQPGRDSTLGVDVRSMYMRQASGANEQTQPLGWAPDVASGQTPPTTPPTQGPARAGWAPTGAALWMAFVFGLGCALYWSLSGNVFSQFELVLETSSNGDQIRLAVALLNFIVDLAVPVAVMLVVWRGRGADRRNGGFVGAVVALVALALTPGALVYALTLTPSTAPFATTLLSWLAPGFPLQLFETPLFAILLLSPSVSILPLSAAYAWGATTRGQLKDSADRWLAPVRWVVVGLSATLGLMVYEFLRVFIFAFFYGESGKQALQQTYTLVGRIGYSQLLVLSIIGALVGGALGGIGVVFAGAGMGRTQVESARRPLRWGRLLALGAFLVALGVTTSLWLPGIFSMNAVTPSPLPEFALLGLAALVPTIIIIVASSVVFRRFGARSGWRVSGMAALSYAPLLLDVLLLALLHNLETTNILGQILDLLLSNAPVALMFGVGVTLTAVFGADDPARWRLRAAAIGALVGVGYALTYLALAVVQWKTPLGPCSGFGGCVLEGAFHLGVLTLLVTFGAEAFELALVGATVGGWLRARAPRAPAGLFTDIAG